MDKRRVTWRITKQGCWICTSHKNNDSGYPVFNKKGAGTRRISRWMFEQKFGKIPKNLLACHRCDCRQCINPAHLFLGSYADNSQDMVRKGRSVRGDKNSHTKLSKGDLVKIKFGFSKGTSMRSLAKQFNIHVVTVWRILKNKERRYG